MIFASCSMIDQNDKLFSKKKQHKGGKEHKTDTHFPQIHLTGNFAMHLFWIDFLDLLIYIFWE